MQVFSDGFEAFMDEAVTGAAADEHRKRLQAMRAMTGIAGQSIANTWRQVRADRRLLDSLEAATGVYRQVDAAMEDFRRAAMPAQRDWLLARFGADTRRRVAVGPDDHALASGLIRTGHLSDASGTGDGSTVTLTLKGLAWVRAEQSRLQAIRERLAEALGTTARSLPRWMFGTLLSTFAGAWLGYFLGQLSMIPAAN